jgi:hypothetical protein
MVECYLGQAPRFCSADYVTAAGLNAGHQRAADDVTARKITPV